MRKCLLFCLVLLLLITTGLAYSVPDDTIVYVTNTGTKYHRESCSYLSSSRAMTIAQAEASGYTPCSRCSPDVLLGEYESDWGGEPGESSVHSTPRPTVKPTPDPTPAPSTSLVFMNEDSENSTEISTEAIYVRLAVCVWLLIFACFLRFRKNKEKYFLLYGGKNILHEAGVPAGIFIDKDRIPRNIDAMERKVEYLLVYVSRSGKKYHTRYCKQIKSKHAITIEEAKRRNLSPCKICKPCGEPPGWLLEYLRIDKIRRKYKIPMLEIPRQRPIPVNPLRTGKTMSHPRNAKKLDGQMCLPMSNHNQTYWMDITVNGKTTRIYASSPEELQKEIEKLDCDNL